MSYKTILIHCNDARRIKRLLGAAIPLADRFGAHLLGLSVVPPVAIASIGPDAPPVVIDEHCKLYRAESPAMKAAFEDAVRGWTFPAEWLEEEAGAYPVAERALQHARAADLVVASQADPDWPGTGRLDISDRLAVESGRPVLIVPNAGTYSPIGRRVLIAWNARREAARAVFDALPILQRADAVRAVWVNPQSEREVAQDIPAADICASLARHGVKCEASEQILPRKGVGETLLASAADFEADLLVMGCYGHARLREFVFGGASRHVLQHMAVPVLMSH